MSIISRVHRGALLLDHKVPGWERRIDLARLNMRDHTLSILGQLGPPSGECIAGNPYVTLREQLGANSHASSDYGFARGDEDASADPITHAWRIFIKSRRSTR